MGASPRIITVDPTGTIARIVRAAMDLVGRQVILVDMSSGREALEEIKSRPCQLVVTNVELDHDIKGYQLAIEVRQSSPNTHVIILADIDDPELDPEDIAGSPFVYLHRPVDIYQFLRVLIAGLDGGDIFAALQPPSSTSTVPQLRDMGDVPHLDVEAARVSIDKLLTDVGAMAIVLANRRGEVLLERGAVGYLDREKLAGALLPMVTTSIDMSELVGGRSSTLQFYDGEEYDVFVLSVGIHHFLCLVFDGSAGNRQFGAVNRFGRRAAEDLIVLLGTSAFTFQKPKPPQVEAPKKGKQAAAQQTQEIFEPIARAAEVKVPEPEPLRLEPISDLDFSIFDQLQNVSADAADDLFSLDKLAELASETLRTGGPIDFDKAQQMGIMPDLDSK
jgi:DNA-binding NarL/FixJ family response regulator